MIFSNIHKSSIVRFLILVTVCLFSFSIAACSGEDGNYDSGSTLINCKTCNGKVAENASDCPHCGERSPVPVSKQAAAKDRAGVIATRLNLYLLDLAVSIHRLNDDYDGDFKLEILLLTPEGGGGPSGPYLKRADDLVDPWGNPFGIEIPGTVNYDFDIISWGEDGEPGGKGENKDVTQ